MDRRPIVAVTGRQRPHELLLLAWSLLSGAVYLLGAPPPGSITALLPTWEVHAWAAGLLASGVVGLVGCLWPWDRGLGLGLELGGMLLGAAALVLYDFAVLSVGGWRALFSSAPRCSCRASDTRASGWTGGTR